MSALATLSGQGAVFVSETSTYEAGLLGVCLGQSSTGPWEGQLKRPQANQTLASRVITAKGWYQSVVSENESNSVTTPILTQVGDTIIGFVACETGTLLSVTDDKGNSYPVIETKTNSYPQIFYVFCGPVTVGGSTTFTANFSGGFTWPQIGVDEYFGVTRLDAHNSAWGNLGTDATPDAIVSPAITPTVGNTIVWAATASADGLSFGLDGTKAGTGWTRRLTTKVAGGYAPATEDKPQAVAASITATFTSPNDSANMDGWFTAIAALDMNLTAVTGSLNVAQASQTLTGAGTGPWTPAALPGLVAWYDVQDAATITVSGGFVTQLNDKGPNGYHAIQATAGAQPTLVSAAINGHPALNFDPSVTIQHLEAIGLPPPLTLFPNGFALYFVSAEQDSGAYGYQVASPLHYSTYNVPEPFGRRDSLMFIGNGSDFQGGFDTYSVMTGNAPAYWGYRYLTSTDTFEDWLNGTQVSTWVANAYPTYYGGNSSDFQIGRRNSLDTVVTGYVGEIIVCNALLESDRLKLEAYLSAKWFGAPPTGITGTLAVTQADQTIAAGLANISIGGTLNASQSQALSGLAKATVGAALNLPQAPQTLSGAAGPVVKGALACTQHDQTILASGVLKVTGTLSANQQPQTLTGQGTAASPNCIGTLQLTQADQTINGHATVAGTVGALSVTQADQTLGALARVVVGGALNAAQAAQTLSGAARANIGGTLTATQADQTLAGQGGTNILAALNQTQGNQTLVGRIDTTGGAILDKLQDSQILAGAAKLTVGASLDLTQASQTLTGLLSIAAGGALRITQDSQLFEGARQPCHRWTPRRLPAATDAHCP